MAKRKVNNKLDLPSNFLSNEKNKLLPLRPQKILFYGIWKCNYDEMQSVFTAKELERSLDVDFRSFEDIKNALENLIYYHFESVNEEKDYIRIQNVFTSVEYDRENFVLAFNPDFKQQLQETKNQFITYGLDIVAEWQCKYTYLLYTYLKEKMWNDELQIKELSLEKFRKLFKLSKDAYQNNSNFKLKVWLPAVEEINKTTGYQINVKEEGRGKHKKYYLMVFDKEELLQKKKKDALDAMFVEAKTDFEPTNKESEEDRTAKGTAYKKIKMLRDKGDIYTDEYCDLVAMFYGENSDEHVNAVREKVKHQLETQKNKPDQAKEEKENPGQMSIFDYPEVEEPTESPDEQSSGEDDLEEIKELIIELSTHYSGDDMAIKHIDERLAKWFAEHEQKQK